MNKIGILQESALHAELKRWITIPGDELEVNLGGFYIDIVRGSQLIEIQTGNFSAIKAKLARLVESYLVRVVYPIAQEKWIVRIDKSGESVLSRRKSPKKGSLEAVFNELVHIPKIALHDNFSLQVLFIQQEDIWRDDGKGSWRRKGWSLVERRLLKVLGNRLLSRPEDYGSVLPGCLPGSFRVQDLASTLKQPRRLAGKIVYTLRQMGILEVAGKDRRAVLYRKRGCDQP